MAAIIVVWLFPPKQSLSSHVNTESRNGMCSSFFFLPLALAAARAAITFPRATIKKHACQRGCTRKSRGWEGEEGVHVLVRDLLMFAPSLSRAPVAPVELARSLPARSTSLSRDRNRTE